MLEQSDFSPLFLYRVRMTASWKSRGSFRCSHATDNSRSSWSLVLNAIPPCFQISVENSVNSRYLACLQLSYGYVYLFKGVWLIRFSFCWLLRDVRMAESWTTRLALKRSWKCSVQMLRMEALSERSAWSSTLRKRFHLVRRVHHHHLCFFYY